MTPTVLALGSAFFWTVANVSIQKAGRRAGPWSTLAYTAVLGLPALILAALLLEGAPTLPGRHGMIALAGGGVSALAAYGGLFVALESGRVSVVAPIVSAWAVIAALWGFAWGGEPISALGVTGIALVAGGNALLARGAAPGNARPPAERRAVLAAATSALGFGLMAPCVEIAGDELGAAWATPGVWLIALLLGAPSLMRRVRQSPDIQRSEALRLSALPALSEAVGFLCLALALHEGTLSRVSPVASLSTGLSVVWGIFALRERLGPIAALGALAASVGVVFVHL